MAVKWLCRRLLLRIPPLKPGLRERPAQRGRWHDAVKRANGKRVKTGWKDVLLCLLEHFKPVITQWDLKYPNFSSKRRSLLKKLPKHSPGIQNSRSFSAGFQHSPNDSLSDSPTPSLSPGPNTPCRSPAPDLSCGMTQSVSHCQIQPLYATACN